MPVNRQNREALLAELEFHKLEFKTLKEEIAKWSDAERQFLYLSIVAAGAGIGLTQIVDGQEIQIVLLLAPLIFHVFFREMLDCNGHINNISKYLIETLIPRANAILKTLATDKKITRVFWYEYIEASNPVDLFVFSIQPMRYWIPVVAIIALLLVYWSNATANSYPIPPLHMFLIILNIIYLITSIVKNARDFRNFKIDSKQIRREAEKGKTNIANNKY